MPGSACASLDVFAFLAGDSTLAAALLGNLRPGVGTHGFGVLIPEGYVRCHDVVGADMLLTPRWQVWVCNALALRLSVCNGRALRFCVFGRGGVTPLFNKTDDQGGRCVYHQANS